MLNAFYLNTGQPIAWAISDVEDTKTFQELFKAMHARVPGATIDTLMTDDGNTCTQIPIPCLQNL